MEFIRQNNELILVYDLSPEYKVAIEDKLEDNEVWNISHCFSVNKTLLRVDSDIPPEQSYDLSFCIGTIEQDYTLINPQVVNTKNKFYFSNEIPLEKKHFIAYRDISILSKIDKLVHEDVYIGGNHQGTTLPLETFNLLIKNFPKTAELNHYANARISIILREFYPRMEEYETKFNRFIENQNKKIQSDCPTSIKLDSVFEPYKKIDLEKFSDLYNELKNLLESSVSIPEREWQRLIHAIIRFLYPKYIADFEEIKIKGVDSHDKRPDFLLVDSNGFIDILEIKKPDKQLLTTGASYRNNYVPVRELSGTVQQIEKYIFCLNTMDKKALKELKGQLSQKLPSSISPKVLNPQGILILGRSKDFNSQQKNDFELIKRQYKNITEIMTYDDLLFRIKNIIEALKLATPLQ